MAACSVKCCEWRKETRFVKLTEALEVVNVYAGDKSPSQREVLTTSHHRLAISIVWEPCIK